MLIAFILAVIASLVSGNIGTGIGVGFVWLTLVFIVHSIVPDSFLDRSIR
jgi:hypothetical protein